MGRLVAVWTPIFLGVDTGGQEPHQRDTNNFLKNKSQTTVCSRVGCMYEEKFKIKIITGWVIFFRENICENQKKHFDIFSGVFNYGGLAP